MVRAAAVKVSVDSKLYDAGVCKACSAIGSKRHPPGQVQHATLALACLL